MTDLGLEHELETTNEDEPLANYIYYPDHLVAMPQLKLDKSQPFDSAASIYKAVDAVLSEPIFKGARSAAMKYFFGGGRKMTLKDGEDLSVYDFFRKATGNPELINNTLGALMHGVWGGNIRNLSMQSGLFSQATLPSPEKGSIWYPKEDKGFRSRMLISESRSQPFLPTVQTYITKALDSEYIWFKNGFSTLTDALVRELKKCDVAFKLNSPIRSISLHPSERIAVRDFWNEGFCCVASDLPD